MRAHYQPAVTIVFTDPATLNIRQARRMLCLPAYPASFHLPSSGPALLQLLGYHWDILITLRDLYYSVQRVSNSSRTQPSLFNWCTGYYNQGTTIVYAFFWLVLLSVLSILCIGAVYNSRLSYLEVDLMFLWMAKMAYPWSLDRTCCWNVYPHNTTRGAGDLTHAFPWKLPVFHKTMLSNFIM